MGDRYVKNLELAIGQQDSTTKVITGVDLKTSATNLYSREYDTYNHYSASLFIGIESTGNVAAGRLQVIMQHSPDGVNWYDMWDTTSGNPNIPSSTCYPAFEIPAGRMRVKVRATGVDNSNFYTVHVWLAIANY